jgi:hypothetical protein
LLLLDGQVHHDTHALPMGNYVIAVGNYVIVSPSELGNYKIADRQRGDPLSAGGTRADPYRTGDSAASTWVSSKRNVCPVEAGSRA